MHTPGGMSLEAGQHPYRDPPQLGAREPVATCHEEKVIYAMLVVIGAIPILLTVLSGVHLEAQCAFGSLMVGSGLVGLVRRAA